MRKKLLQKGFIPHHAMVRGFTLIELLIVMAVVAVLAGIVLVGIDPVDKINSANDAKVQNDIRALANASETYAVSNSGTYTTSTASLIANGDLKIVPVAPNGYTTYAITGGGASATVYSNLKAKKYVASPFWVWCSSSGRAGATAASGTCP